MSEFKPGDRVVWRSAAGPRKGVVREVDTSVRDTGRGAGVGWPVLLVVLFDDNANRESFVSASECVLEADRIRNG